MMANLRIRGLRHNVLAFCWYNTVNQDLAFKRWEKGGKNAQTKALLPATLTVHGLRPLPRGEKPQAAHDKARR